METINYSAMSDEELNSYFLQHREDRLALENYLDRVNNRPHQVITTVDDPDFDAKIHAVTKQKILNNNNGKSSIENIYRQFQQKVSDFLYADLDVSTGTLKRLIKFIDTTPIISEFIQQRVSAHPREIINDREQLLHFIDAIQEDEIKDFDEVTDEQNISFFYWLLKSTLKINEIHEDQDYSTVCTIFVYIGLVGNLPKVVHKFNKDYIQPHFISHINSYLESIIMEDQKKQVNAVRNIYAKEYHEHSQIGINHMSGGKIEGQARVAGVINEAEQRNLAEVAKEIQQLLDQLSEIYPTTTTSEKYEVAAKAIRTIEDDSLLMSKIIRVVKAALFEALKQAVNHPLVNIVMAGIEEALDKN